jgi:hypothetical protein
MHRNCDKTGSYACWKGPKIWNPKPTLPNLSFDIPPDYISKTLFFCTWWLCTTPSEGPQQMKSETYSSRPFIWYTTWLPFKNFNIFFALDDLAPHPRKGPNIWNPLPGMRRSVGCHYDDVIHPVTWLWRRCTSRLGMCYGEVPLFQNPGFSTISNAYLFLLQLFHQPYIKIYICGNTNFVLVFYFVLFVSI